MTYILTLKENSFNNGLSTHVSLGMVYKSTFLLHLDRTLNYSIRYTGKQQKWRQIDNLVSGTSTSFPGSLGRVGENPRLRGRLALLSNIDQKSDGLWERECLGELVPMRSNETGATTKACRLHFRKCLKCATSKMRRSTDVFILRLGRIKFTSYAAESSIFVTSEALN